VSGGGAPPVHVGPNPPTNPEEGQQWLNTDTDTLYIYVANGVGWVPVGGSSGGNVEGGNASSIYLPSQTIDGGSA